MSKELRHILCIDDEDDILEVVRVSLETAGGFQVTCSHSGTEGISLAREARPDLILLDVMMPGMDGPTTLKKLRDDPSLDYIPIVFLTARSQPSEQEEYLRLGGAAVIVKPFDPMTISDEILTIWRNLHV